MEWDYLLWGIRWPIVQRMLADGPDYGNGKDRKESDHEALLDKINAIKRG